MTNEEMQRTMQFLLEQQAQFTVRLQKDEEQIKKDEERIAKDEERIARVENAILLLTELARRADERMDDADKRMNNFDAHLSASMESFDARINILNEKMAETGEHLNALTIMVERYLSNRNGSPQS